MRYVLKCHWNCLEGIKITITMADSYVATAAREAGSAAEEATTRKDGEIFKHTGSLHFAASCR